MNAGTIAKQYDRLTSEERFRLILAAGGRGDRAEQSRLAGAGHRISLSMQDHFPNAMAFYEVSFLTFVDLVEDAARFSDVLHLAWTTDTETASEEEADEEAEKIEPGGAPHAETPDERTPAEEAFSLVLAAGYILRTNAAGWRLFCERMGVPPFAHWKLLPGFDRLEDAMQLTDRVALVPEGMLRFLNRVRRAGEPEHTSLPAHLTVEGIADAAAEGYRYALKWWGAERGGKP